MILEVKGIKLSDALKKTISRLKTKHAEIQAFMKEHAHAGHPACATMLQARSAITAINAEVFRLEAQRDILVPTADYRLSMKTFLRDYATTLFDGLSLPAASEPCEGSGAPGTKTLFTPKSPTN